MDTSTLEMLNLMIQKSLIDSFTGATSVGVSWFGIGLVGALLGIVLLAVVVYVNTTSRKAIDRDNITEQFDAVKAQIAQLTAKNG